MLNDHLKKYNFCSNIEILFDLEDLSNNELSGVPIYTILPQHGSDTDQDIDKSYNEHEENRMCHFCKTSWFKRTSVIMETTTNIHLKPLVLQQQQINYFG